MEASRKILEREYEDFLVVVQKASQLGTMRENILRLESAFLDKFKISICIRDTGSGAKLSRAVRDNEIVGIARDVGDTGKELFKFLFGNK